MLVTLQIKRHRECRIMQIGLQLSYDAALMASGTKGNSATRACMI